MQVPYCLDPVFFFLGGGGHESIVLIKVPQGILWVVL